MIVVTGAAGFIGSNIVKGLNTRGHNNILAVDDLTQGDKFINLSDLDLSDYMHKDEFRQLVLDNALPKISGIIHQGACSDTTESNGHYMMDNNYKVTLELFNYCQAKRIPFLYASSAAVYGAGPNYAECADNESPLNVYGYSKYLFDQILRRRLNDLTAPVVGLRYFNVYGPNEQHKGRMSSVALHNMGQFKQDGCVKLFGAYDGYGNGQQQRDFIYIDDVVDVNMHFFENAGVSGVFNCGTGKAQPFNDVASSVVNNLRALTGESALSLSQLVHNGYIQYIDFPNDLKGKYQSHTQANLDNLRSAGYTKSFLDVNAGVSKYIQHLSKHNKI